MVKAVGIDPGTRSVDLFGFEDTTGKVFADVSVPREEVTKEPSCVIRLLRRISQEVGGLDAVVAPSGYGIPLKPAREANDREILEATFVSKADEARGLRIVGLRRLMFELREADDLEVWFTPSVIQLPTVPAHRKANRIDLGTADKVYTAVLAIKDQAERLGLRYGETSLIAVEVGYAYTAALAVKGGKIIDGVGGTSGLLGYLGMGSLDAELFYALSNTCPLISKEFLFRGGASTLAGMEDPAQLLDFLSKSDEKRKVAYEAFVEAILKDLALVLTTHRRPKEVLLSGRFFRYSEFLSDVRGRVRELLRDFGIPAEVRKLQTKAKVAKEAAEGAAILANALAGGKHKELVDVMEITASAGSIFDHLSLGGLEARVREEFSRAP